MNPTRATPKAMATRLVRLLRPQHPDYHYLKKVFQHTREFLAVGTAPPVKRLPELLTDAELVAFYEAIWHAHQLTHAVMLKLLLFTGIRNAELVHLRPTDIDLQTCQIRITQGKGHKDRYVLFPTSFRGELAQYLARQQQDGATYLFESFPPLLDPAPAPDCQTVRTHRRDYQTGLPPSVSASVDDVSD